MVLKDPQTTAVLEEKRLWSKPMLKHSLTHIYCTVYCLCIFKLMQNKQTPRLFYCCGCVLSVLLLFKSRGLWHRGPWGATTSVSLVLICLTVCQALPGSHWIAMLRCSSPRCYPSNCETKSQRTMAMGQKMNYWEMLSNVLEGRTN